jgi:spore coat polysaccharide biosynthesis protein SpsF
MGMSAAQGRALAVVQARMSSTRLPGKVLADVGGEPMLALLLRRLRPARSLGAIVLATSVESHDDEIAALGLALGVAVSRGPLEDVLARFTAAIGEHEGPVVRVTGDCPLIDPALVDAVVERFVGSPGCVYASNIEPRTFPDGLDVEAIDAAMLRRLDAQSLAAEQREHVTAGLRGHSPRATLVNPVDLGDLRWTVDRAEDLEFVRALVGRLGERRHRAGMREILRAVRREPSLADDGGWRRG